MHLPENPAKALFLPKRSCFGSNMHSFLRLKPHTFWAIKLDKDWLQLWKARSWEFQLLYAIHYALEPQNFLIIIIKKILYADLSLSYWSKNGGRKIKYGRTSTKYTLHCEKETDDEQFNHHKSGKHFEKSYYKHHCLKRQFDT